MDKIRIGYSLYSRFLMKMIWQTQKVVTRFLFVILSAIFLCKPGRRASSSVVKSGASEKISRWASRARSRWTKSNDDFCGGYIMFSYFVEIERIKTNSLGRGRLVFSGRAEVDAEICRVWISWIIITWVYQSLPFGRGEYHFESLHLVHPLIWDH